MSRLTRVWLVAVMAAVVVGAGTFGAGHAGLAQAAAPDCDRQIIILPPLTAGGSATVSAMNERGWVVGRSYDPQLPAAAVLWRGPGAPLDLQLGGATLANGDKTSGHPVDVNERGVVAVQRHRSNAKETRHRGTSAWLWRDGVRTRLRGTAYRRQATVEAVNDRGVAAGWIRGRKAKRHPAVPVVWRKGVLTRLPIPRGATGVAVENNNHGLVIGSVRRRGAQTWTPWWWRLGGRSGPLRTLDNYQYAEAVDVDDRGRIIGRAPRGVLWRPPSSAPTQILAKQYDVVAMSDRGDLTGARGGFRGYGARAWVGRLSGRAARLPDPPTEDANGWENIYGSDLTRGVTAFAPQGGVTVGGAANGDDLSRAVLWTCAQTYLP